MAADWIKMRSNLWDDPRVTAICDRADCAEATAIGGLYWLWATADQHSPDGCLPGLTARSIDRKTGIPGFAEAVAHIGWIYITEDGVQLARFGEHNGASAKSRIQTAKRVADHKANAKVTHTALPEQNESITDALPREREREREELKTTPLPTDVGNPPKPKRKPRKVASEGDPYPDDFWPTQAGIDAAEAEGFVVQIEMPKFRDHHAIKQTLSGNWQASWRSWIRKAVEFRDAAALQAKARASPRPEKFDPVEYVRQHGTHPSQQRQRQQHERDDQDRNAIDGTAVRVA